MSLTKITLGVLGTTGIVVTGWGSHYFHNKPSTIGEELQKQGLQLLKDDEKVKILIQKHKSSEVEIPKKIRNLNLELNVDNEENKNKQALLNKCQQLWDTKISTSDNEDQNTIRQEIKDWCVTTAKALGLN